MKKLKITYIILLIIGLNLLAINSPAASACEDIEQGCNEVIRAADSLILSQSLEINMLKNANEDLLSQINTQQEKLLDLQYKPWYSSNTTMFLLGIITGGILYEKVSNH